MIYPWQQKQFDLLQDAFRQDRLSHAYLLSGASGLGKTDFARAFGTFLLCDNKTSIACGSCRSCKQCNADTHPDLMMITPEEKSTIIKIDQIRELSEKLSQTAHSGGYQVVIMSPADSMPVQAANALLKTLEEPSGKIIIFLIDDQKCPLPLTIYSRCQKIPFSADEKNALSWLKKTMPNEKNIDILFRLSGHAPLAVKKLSENHFLSLRDEILNHLDNIFFRQANPIAPVVNWAKQDVNRVLTILLLLCVDISRRQNNTDPEYILNLDQLPKIEKIAKKISPEALHQWIDLINEKKLFLSRGINLNMQLCLEDVLVGVRG